MSDGLKLLAAALDTGGTATLREMQADYFIDNEKEVYEYIRRHYRRYRELPSFETIREETGVRLPATQEPYTYYMERVVDRKLYNEIYDQFAVLREAMKTRNMDNLRASVGTMRRITREQSVSSDVRTFGEGSQEVLEAYEHAKQNPGMNGVPSGWHDFDDETGGYQAGDLISLVARMGIGKTYLLLSQALHAWQQGHTVLVVTMEMTITQILRRASGMEAGVNPEYIRKGALSIWAERRLRSVLANMAHSDRFIVYAGGFSKSVDDVDLLMQEFSPDMTYIDGGYLLKPAMGRKEVGRFERVAEVMDALKKMTITHDRPILQTSQFSRQAGKKGKEGSLETIGFTDAIGTHSSLVAGVKEGRNPNPYTRRLIDIMKGREGEHGEFEVRYTFAPIDFSQVPLPRDSEGNRIIERPGASIPTATAEQTQQRSPDWEPAR